MWQSGCMVQPVDCPPRPARVGGATRVDYGVPGKLGWRGRLKSTPTGRYWFRLAVAIFGFALIIAAPLTGWLPGPGGIPLFLAGLAVLSSEFLWAKSVNRWLLRYVRVYVCWPVNQRRFFWVAVVGVAGLLWWASLAIIGIPAWMPDWAAGVLEYLPGVS